MTKFIIGQTVRCVSVCGGERTAKVGGLYTVVHPNDHSHDLLDVKTDEGKLISMFAYRFEAVKAPAAPKPGTRLEQVLKHLLTGKTLTQGEAIVLGYGTRLAASVHRLKAKGHTIVATMKEDLHGSPYAEYRLVTRRPNGNRKAA